MRPTKIGTAVLASALTLVPTLLVAQEGQRQRAPRAPRFSALPEAALAPADNPLAAERIALGRLLFWDPVLSGNRDVACATCHHPRFGYTDGRDLSIGVSGVGLGESRHFPPGSAIPFVKRNSPTILNTGFNGIDRRLRYDPATAPMFWDRRARSLEAQALEPIKSFEEMRGDAYAEAEAVDVVVARLREIAAYRTLFAKAFGGDEPVTADNLAKALASFGRSLTATNSSFDRFMRGDSTAMTAQQIRGMRSFRRVGCDNCHSGPMFSDFRSHVLSVPDNEKLRTSDAGIRNRYAFRTASLRNLAYTAPYMHSGVFQTLEEVLQFYDDIEGGDPRNPHVTSQQIDRRARRLDDVADEAQALIAFLSALNDDSFDTTIPERVPSGLQPGGGIR